jgi:hypothetical protein
VIWDTDPKRWKIFGRLSIYVEAQQIWKALVRLWASHKEINQAQNLQLGGNEPQWLITGVLWTNLTMKAQLTHRFFEIPKQKFIHFWTLETLNTVMRSFYLEFMNSYWSQMERIFVYFSGNWNFPSFIRQKNFYKVIFQTVGGLERGPLSFVRTIEELLDWKSSGSGLENRD